MPRKDGVSSKIQHPKLPQILSLVCKKKRILYAAEPQERVKQLSTYAPHPLRQHFIADLKARKFFDKTVEHDLV